MQLKQFHNISTKVSSRKSANTFGDLPDDLLDTETRKLMYQYCDSHGPKYDTLNYKPCVGAIGSDWWDCSMIADQSTRLSHYTLQ